MEFSARFFSFLKHKKGSYRDYRYGVRDTTLLKRKERVKYNYNFCLSDNAFNQRVYPIGTVNLNGYPPHGLPRRIKLGTDHSRYYDCTCVQENALYGVGRFITQGVPRRFDLVRRTSRGGCDS